MGLQNKVIKGMAWSSVGQAAALSLSFISNIILARLLSPNDFGCIGMLAIFLTISSVFVNGGFGMALIQKKNATSIDYTTIFWWNLAISFFFVVLLFFAAPYIANFYHIPLLKDVLRVLSLELILTAIAIVPTNQLKKEFRFKQLAVRTIVSTSIALIVTIFLAFNGYGIWSLVAHNLVKALIIDMLLWRMTKWRPSIDFSVKAFKEMFGFGSMMLLSNLINTIYNNVNGLIIGRLFSASQMGFYSQARKLEEIPSLSLSAVINEVSFSAFSSIQDEKDRLLLALRKNIASLSFLCFPMFFLLIELGADLIPFLYGDKWISAVPYFRILCFSSMLYTITLVYESVIKALGKGKFFFALFTANRILGLIMIFMGIPFGVEGMLFGVVIASYCGFFMDMIANKKLVEYKFKLQIVDILPYYLLSACVMAFTRYTVGLIEIPSIIKLIIESVFYISVYLCLTKIFHLCGFNYVMQNILKRR